MKVAKARNGDVGNRNKYSFRQDQTTASQCVNKRSLRCCDVTGELHCPLCRIRSRAVNTCSEKWHPNTVSNIFMSLGIGFSVYILVRGTSGHSSCASGCQIVLMMPHVEFSSRAGYRCTVIASVLLGWQCVFFVRLYRPKAVRCV